RRACEQEAVERAAEAEREAERQREREAYRQAERERLRTLEAEARKRFGADGPLPGDVELADSLSGRCVTRGGRPISWQAALPADIARIGVLQAHRPVLQGDRLRGGTTRARAAAERGPAAAAVNI